MGCIYNFWKQLNKDQKQAKQRYIQMFYNLLYRNQVCHFDNMTNIMLLFFPLSFYFISTNQYLYFFIHIVLATGEECSYTKRGGSTRFSKACQTTTGKEARLTRKKNVGFNKEISAKLCRHQIDLDIYINIFF